MTDLIEYYVYIFTKPYLDDGVWRIFGFKHRPKHGLLAEKMMPQKFIYENLVSKALWFITLADMVSSIKRSSHSSNMKHVILVGILDKLLSISGMFDKNTFVDEFITFYAEYMESGSDSTYASLIRNAQNTLGEKDLGHYTVGIIKLMSSSTSEGLLLDIPTMVKHANNVNLGGSKLGLSMGVEYFERYNKDLIRLVS